MRSAIAFFAAAAILGSSSASFEPGPDPLARNRAPGGKRRNNRRGKPGPSGCGSTRAAQRLDFIHESQRQGNAIAKEHSDRRTYDAWFASLTPAEQAFAREHDIDRYQSDRTRPPSPHSSEDALDAADRDPIPEAQQRGSHNGRPIVALENPAIDAMEPENLTVEIADLTREQITDAGETFGAALRWALEGGQASSLTRPVGFQPAENLVSLGLRAACLIATMRPDLAVGLPVDPTIARRLLESFHDLRLSETLAHLQSSGEVYARILEWLRRATSISGLGERLQLVAYQFRPALLDAATLAELGEATNKTRQAKNKGSNCLRDTFAGLAALVQRPDITRLRCRAAQLA